MKRILICFAIFTFFVTSIYGQGSLTKEQGIKMYTFFIVANYIAFVGIAFTSKHKWGLKLNGIISLIFGLLVFIISIPNILSNLSNINKSIPQIELCTAGLVWITVSIINFIRRKQEKTDYNRLINICGYTIVFAIIAIAVIITLSGDK